MSGNVSDEKDSMSQIRREYKGTIVLTIAVSNNHFNYRNTYTSGAKSNDKWSKRWQGTHSFHFCKTITHLRSLCHNIKREYHSYELMKEKKRARCVSETSK